jgi:hypothetical protein
VVSQAQWVRFSEEVTPKNPDCNHLVEVVEQELKPIKFHQKLEVSHHQSRRQQQLKVDCVGRLQDDSTQQQMHPIPLVCGLETQP